LQRLLGMTNNSESDRLNAITEKIIGAAIRVHEALGPGILESAYEACLTFELIDLGLTIERQKSLPVVYRGCQLDCGYRIDLLVEHSVIVEVKSIERLERVHSAQVLSYLRLTRLKLGLLINFNVPWLQSSIKRIVNAFPE
jgi:GxxExxY protein